ncbi:GGDEF domain-containing protein [Alkalimarinus alittae]|uniref:diguanylate cyclase n=1 Tax=Alkalimarinus alittae TaxID=2961619 RepID=A0ABY6N5T8_9ALTE|nr:GGDEF domain-containing protein [Alkalimarinus alittae]UZE97354.1 GGDEF domain-containing protein [Alkalimarinus alittae]
MLFRHLSRVYSFKELKSNMFSEPNLNVLFSQLVGSWQDGVMLLDDSLTIRYSNTTFHNMTKDQWLISDEALPSGLLGEVFVPRFAQQLQGLAEAIFRVDDPHWLSDHLIITDDYEVERHFSVQALPLSLEVDAASGNEAPKWVAICLKNISALIRHEVRGNELELELEQNSLRDEVTGLSSRAYWESWLSSEFNRSKRYQQDLSILLIDLATHHENLPELPVDAYVNVLADVALLIQGVLRNSDQAARYSDKRIVALLPHTNSTGSEILAARINAKIEHYLEESELQEWVEFRMGVAVFHGVPQTDEDCEIDRYDDLLQLAEDDLLS